MLFNTDNTGMDSQLTHATQLIEMNQAVRLLWRHGYSLQDLGASVIVDDPVSRVVRSQIAQLQAGRDPQLRGRAPFRGCAQLNRKGPRQWTPLN